MTKTDDENKVFIERASPLTRNGIRSMCCSDEEYNWYVCGLEDGRQSAQKEFEKLIDEWAKEKYWDADNECILTEEDLEELKSKLKSATTNDGVSK